MKYALPLLLWSSLAFSAETIPPIAVIEPQDIQEMQKIVDEQLPRRWAEPVVRWLDRLIERQNVRKKAEAEKQKEEDK